MSISISDRSYKVIYLSKERNNETIVKCPLHGVWENVRCANVLKITLLSRDRERDSESSKNQISISRTRYNTQIVKSFHDQWEQKKKKNVISVEVRGVQSASEGE